MVVHQEEYQLNLYRKRRDINKGMVQMYYNTFLTEYKTSATAYSTLTLSPIQHLSTQRKEKSTLYHMNTKYKLQNVLLVTV